MSYNILNKNVNFQGTTQGTVEDLADTHSDQTISGLKTITHLTGTNVKVTNDINVFGNVSASVNISASFFYGDGSTLSNIDSISFDGSTANGILTFKDADEASVESSLTFDGSVLDFKTTSISGSGNISGSTFWGSGAGLTGILGSAVTLASGGGITDSSGLKLDVGVDAIGSLNIADKILIFDADGGDAVKRTTAGDIAGLFDPVVSTFNGQTLHRVVTVGGTETIDGEANLTFNGSVLTITGDVSGSQVISGSIGHFVTRVEATAISLGDATGLAGLGLTNGSGELDVQVSGALHISSDKVAISGSFAGSGLSFAGAEEGISSIAINLASSSGLQLSSGELSVNLNSLGTATPLFSADSIVFIDADDGSTKKSAFSNFVATMAGDGLVNNSGRFDINVSGAMALQSDKLVLSSSVAGNGLEVAAGDGQMVNTLSVKVSDFMGNGVNNRIVTAADANSMNAEENLSFGGTTLELTGTLATRDTGNTAIIMESTVGASGSLLLMRYKEIAHTCTTSAASEDIADFFTTNMIPFALGIRVTTAITRGDASSPHITKIGTVNDDDSFGTFGDNDLEQAGDNLVTSYHPANATGQNTKWFTSNHELKITYAAQPAAGALRLGLYYYEITPPTS